MSTGRSRTSDHADVHCAALGVGVHIDYSINGAPLELGRVMAASVILTQTFRVNLIFL